MDSSQLEAILYKHPATKLYFGGVYAKDTLPWKAKHQCYIVNLDSSKEPGSHWMAVFFSNHGQAEFFDSFGFPPTIDKNIHTFISRNSVQWIYNAQQLQNHRTVVCGQYCVFFLINRCLGKTLQKIISYFTTNQLKNDHFVKEYVEKNFVNMYLKLT